MVDPETIRDPREDIDRFFVWKPETETFQEYGPHAFACGDAWGQGEGIHSLAARWDGERYKWTTEFYDDSREALLQFIKIYHAMEPPTEKALALEEAYLAQQIEPPSNKLTLEEAKEILRPCSLTVEVDVAGGYAETRYWSRVSDGEWVGTGYFGFEGMDLVEIQTEEEGEIVAAFRGPLAKELRDVPVEGEGIRNYEY